LLLLEFNKQSPTLFLDLLSSILKEIESSTQWQQKVFGFHGIHQCILDISFLLLVFDQHITDDINDCANKITEKALNVYYVQNPNSPPLKASDFYDDRAQDAMEELFKKETAITTPTGAVE
jgi:hypothetical protein